MRTDILERENEIRQWIHYGRSKTFMCTELKCKSDTLNSYLEKLGISYEGNPGHNYHRGEKSPSYIPLMEYLKQDNCKRDAIKEKMFREGYKEYKCEICGAYEWQGRKLPLELHHKNGDTFDNEYDNLQILCPNCHSIQGGDAGRSKGKYSCDIDDSCRLSKDVSCEKEIQRAQREILRRKQLAEEARLRKEERLSKQQEDVERRKNLIVNSGVDFSKLGWVVKVSEIPGIGVQRHKITKWMKKHMPEFLDNCYIYERDRPHTYDKNEK